MNFKDVVLSGQFLILDTETTGLDDGSEIVEIAVINAYGEPQINTLVRPTKPIPPEVTDIHGINNEMVQKAPSWVDVRPHVLGALSGRDVIVYNASFDLEMLQRTDQAHGMPMRSWLLGARTWWCAMREYAVFHGEWNEYRKSYRWQQLSAAARQCQLYDVANAHRALADCLATLGVCKRMVVSSEYNPPAGRGKV